MNGNEKAVTSFDLEPNPFEQSFASSKKPMTERSELRQGAEGVVESLHDRRVSPSLVVTGTDPRSLSSQSTLANTKSLTAHSPVMLSPGGSRRLPPIGLSGEMPGQGSPGSFYLTMSKNSLTPNHSSIRSGLTPNGVGMGIGMGMPNGIQLQNNSSVIPAALPSGTGFTPGRFTPMLNSLLSIPTQSVATVTSSAIGTGVTTGVTTTNALGTVDANSKDPGSTNSADSSKYSTILSINSGSTHSMLSTASQLNLHSDTLESVHKGNSNNGLNQLLKENETHLDPHRDKRSPIDLTDTHNNFLTMEKNRSIERTDTSKTSKKKRKTSSIKRKSISITNNLESSDLNSFENNINSLDTDTDRERKRKEFLERNRIAASRFRKRKKEYIKRIEADLDFYQQEYKDLTSCLATLTGLESQSSDTLANPPSLINSLKQALLTQNINSAIQTCNLLEQAVLKTNYVKRHGVNPREHSNKLEEMDDSDS